MEIKFVTWSLIEDKGKDKVLREHTLKCNSQHTSADHHDTILLKSYNSSVILRCQCYWPAQPHKLVNKVNQFVSIMLIACPEQ